MKREIWKEIFLDIFFPKFCLLCQKEGSFLCEDCFSLLPVSHFHQKYKGKYLDDLYFALDYEKSFIYKIICFFKYPPLIKELGKDLANLIFYHFFLLEEKINFSDFSLIAVPLSQKKLKWRGFNQAEEIAKTVAHFFQIPLIVDCLVKTKETKNQIELSEKERKENIKGVFTLAEKEKVVGKNILLVDDVFTTGSTMEECARVLKEGGAKKVIGIVVARAKPGKDNPISF